MKQKIIGTYPLGYEQIQLVLREGTGGEFFTLPEDGKIPRIKIGADNNYWWETVELLLHEVNEFCMMRLACRYNQSNSVLRDHSNYLFVMTHVQFGECCARSAELLAKALPDLGKAWNKWKRNEKK